MKILGLNAFGHDTSACLVIDGDVICAISEERLSREKHDRSFPFRSIQSLLRNNSLTISDIDAIGLNLEIDYHLEEFFNNCTYPIAKDIRQSERIKIFENFKRDIKANYDGVGLRPINHNWWRTNGSDNRQ